MIASIARTPIGKFCGSLSGLLAPELGAHAIKGALSSLPTDVKIREAYLGNVVSAGIGQAPARQAVKGAKLPDSTICTTVNKVCASGMKATTLAAQTLQCAGSSSSAGFAMLSGGMESMSNVPHYLPKSRSGTTLGHAKLLDGVIHDGLWDVYGDQHMGMCGEKCASDHGFRREDQDAFAMESYKRAQAAVAGGFFTEISPITIPPKRKGGDPLLVDKDDEPDSVNLDKLSKLRPAFDPLNGTITAANASSLNDGAAAMVLMTEQDAMDWGVAPLARIRGFGDAEQDPINFPTSPSLAVPVALEHAGLEASDIEYHEINEAFSVVALYVPDDARDMNEKKLSI